jgi:hypothetical protein
VGLLVARNLYDGEFFSSYNSSALESARIVVPIVCEMIRPVSVVDVGCAKGAWLLAFKENGVGRLRGVDGDYVDETAFLVEADSFTAVDLNSRDFKIDGNYDLACCLEVAEHLLEANAGLLVKALTGTAPVVLFSAAVPGQGGTGHVNEQWLSYWSALFEKRKFKLLDPIRPMVRENRRVAWWYRQNLVLFVAEDYLAAHPELTSFVPESVGAAMEWVHIGTLVGRGTVEFVIKRLRKALWSRIRGVASNKSVADSASKND